MPWWNCHKLWAVLKVITALNYNYFLIFKSNLKSILWFKTKEVLHIIFHNKYSHEVVSHWYIGIVPMASFSKNWQFSQKKEKARKIEQYLSSYMNNLMLKIPPAWKVLELCCLTFNYTCSLRGKQPIWLFFLISTPAWSTL